VVNWQDLLAALALVLVLEGIFPFLNPSGMRKKLLTISQMQDGQLRMIGMISMAFGLVLLFFVRA
jgi:uncharacterized protein YjeT (DUF2065 family)